MVKGKKVVIFGLPGGLGCTARASSIYCQVQ
jgi:peroxiredoxin